MLTAVATPAHASDFTGMGTFLASLYGVVMLIVAGGLYGISFLGRAGKVRHNIRWAGMILGIALTLWWVAVPIAEGTALAIVLAILFLAFVTALASRSAHGGKGRS
jgi:hypothetical protein